MSSTATLAAELPMPRLSDSMEEGTIVRWLKAVGDTVAAGEDLVEIETDKAEVVFESYLAGTLLEVLLATGETAAVGVPIARIGDPDAEPAPSRAEAPTPGAPAPRGGKVKASPVAKRLAADLGVDLATVTGSGPGGRITKADVETAADTAAAPADAPATPADAPPIPADAPPAAPATPPAAPAPTGKGDVRLVTPTTLQRTVARRMVEAKTTIPHFHVSTEIDMTLCRDARARVRASGGRPPSYNDMVVKACALALREHPLANASWTEAGFELYSRVNIGIAVAAEGVLMVPTIRDADRKGLTEIAAESARLAQEVRSGRIVPADLADGTFTVSNLGMFGTDDFAAVVNPPQVAILAVGAIVERPIGRDGALVLAPTMRATLGCDHRVLYGADAATLLARVRQLLEEPLGLAG